MHSEFISAGESDVDETVETSEVQPAAVIAGFWVRVFAFLIDSLILGAVGMALGLMAFDWLARQNGYERLVGLALVLGYAGVLNSRLGRGQTLGKLLVGARVLRTDGKLLSLPRSLARQAILAAPFFLNSLIVSPDAGLIASLLSLVIFGGFATVFYLLCFNRRTRQSLHDLAVGSYVTRVPPAVSIPLATHVWRPHLVVAGALALLSLAAPSAVLRLAASMGFAQSLAGLSSVQSQLAALPGVQAASIVDGATKQLGGPTTKYVSVRLKLSAPRWNDEQLARQVAELVRLKYPASGQRDAIVVSLTYGFNMVIASSTRSQSFRFPATANN